ncbi:serine/threonine-protein kinase [Actinomadura vinacea]|uniref:Serine/threonine-protein kinase n=1 Tax=Actinomadura vinacea TaxID=115336 RepID=A0ABP5WNQ7_9ACTN
MRVDDFELLDDLGSGPIGRTYRAEEIVKRRAAVVTVLHPHWSASGCEEEFTEAVQRMMRVRGPNVVRTLDGGVAPEGWWVAVDHLAGRPLDAVLDGTGPLNPYCVVGLARHMAAGLAALHEGRMLHGALKPANVIVTPAGPQLVDYGLLPLLSPLADGAPAGPAVNLRGDPAYMSPRVVAEPQLADADDDVHSLGMILLHALLGRRPYDDLELMSTAMRVLCEGPPVDLIPYRDLRKLIGRCLGPRPAGRRRLAGLVPRRAPSVHSVIYQAAKLHSADDRWFELVAADRSGQAAARAPERTAEPSATRADGAPQAALPAAHAAPVPAPPPAPVPPQRTKRPEHGGGPEPGASPRGTPSRVGPWRFPTQGMVLAIRPAGKERLLVTSQDGRVYAVHPVSGKELWRYGGPGTPLLPPARMGHDELLVAAAAEGLLVVLDARDGTERRRRQIDCFFAAPPAAAHGTACVPTADGRLLVFDGDLSVRHSISVGSLGGAAPVLVSGLAFVGTSEGLLVVDVTSGKHRLLRIGDVEGCGVAAVGGTVYTGTAAGDVVAIAHDGTEKWRVHTKGQVTGRPACVDGRVYAGSHDHHVYALDSHDGRMLWPAAATEGPVVAGPVVAGGTVYAGAGDHRLYAFDADDGARRWTFPTGGAINSAPVVGADLVYTGSADGHLYAVQRESGRGDPAEPHEIDVRLRL